MTHVPFIPSVTLRQHLRLAWLAVGNRLFTTNEWLCKLLITSGAGQFIAVGFGGVIITSTDGATWVVRAADPSANVSLQFQHVSYGGGQFVAVGGNGLIQTSPNGINWTTRTSGTVAELYGVTAGNNGLWVAVGTNSTIVTSPDGVVWTPQTVVGINTFLSSVAFNTAMGQFVVVANTSNRLLTSPNGLIWTAHPSGTSSLKGVRYLNGQFIAVGDYGTIRSSPEGTTWKPLTITGQMHFEGAAYGNGSYVAVGSYTTDPDIQTSTVSLAVTSDNGVNTSSPPRKTRPAPTMGYKTWPLAMGCLWLLGRKPVLGLLAESYIILILSLMPAQSAYDSVLHSTY